MTDPATPLSRKRRALIGSRRTAQAQRGGFVMGLIVGLVIGLALALGVALYVTKAPVPFVNKVPQRSAEQDAAEAQRNKNWDPNAPLASKVPRPVAPASDASASDASAPSAGAAPAAASGPAAGPAAGTTTSATPPARNPAAILAGQAPTPAGAASAPGSAKAAKAGDPFTYFVQAGAFQRAEDAETQRAKLTMMGLEPRVLEREQSGRTVYRVRLGPFEKQAEAEALRDRLAGTGMEAALVRVERPAQ